MRELFILTAHLLVTLAKLAMPGGLGRVAAESLAVKHQLLVMKRVRRRAPKLTAWDRLVLGVCALFVTPQRLSKVAVILQPSTLLGFHHALVRRKYHLLYSPRNRRRSGPKGPSKQLIDAVVEMKRRNPRFGCRKIAEHMARAFAIAINKDVVRRILMQHYRPRSGGGPSWLSAIGQAKDSLWSIDFFRCESILIKGYWIMVVMDVFTRRIVGFGVAATDLDGPAICRMFNHVIVLSGSSSVTKSSITTTAVTPGWAEPPRLIGAAFPYRPVHNLSPMPGGLIVTAYFRPQSPVLRKNDQHALEIRRILAILGGCLTRSRGGICVHHARRPELVADPRRHRPLLGTLSATKDLARGRESVPA